ncbi:hypothetical protein ACIQU6_03395 [Streptomyces sp. NPDC090442]|uniref:hypothetical protein n=1 Tax=Streptomyces sp. NPDC090442 TaxID=3365962 RepID=UPI0038257352
MARKYAVDWTDLAYPQIVPAELEPFGTKDPVTLGEARQEIYDHADEIIAHWREVKKRAREMTAAVIESEAARFHEPQC